MKWPLVGSAAGHVALLICLLFIRASTGPGVSGPVDVVLIGGDVNLPGDGQVANYAAGRQERATVKTPDPVRAPSVDRPPAGTSRSVPQHLPHPNPSAETPLLLPSRLSPASPATSPRDAGLAAGSGISSAGTGGEAAFAAGIAGGMKESSVPGGAIRGNRGEMGGETREIGLLRERIESRIVYPPEAVRRGQEGEVLLRIRVGEGGLPREIRIARSSGFHSLDEAARNGVTKAAPLPSSPGWFEVPVRFFLR
jgi:protein TonB